MLVVGPPRGTTPLALTSEESGFSAHKNLVKSGFPVVPGVKTTPANGDAQECFSWPPVRNGPDRHLVAQVPVNSAVTQRTAVLADIDQFSEAPL